MPIASCPDPKLECGSLLRQNSLQAFAGSGASALHALPCKERGLSISMDYITQKFPKYDSRMPQPAEFWTLVDAWLALLSVRLRAPFAILTRLPNTRQSLWLQWCRSC